MVFRTSGALMVTAANITGNAYPSLEGHLLGSVFLFLSAFPVGASTVGVEGSRVTGGVTLEERK